MTEALTENVLSIIEPEDNLDNDHAMDIWEINDNKRVCIPCRDIGHNEDIPENLKSHNKSSFGILKIRPLSERNKNTKKEQKKQYRDHESNPLHKWCLYKYLFQRKEEKEEETKNIKASETIARHVIFCLLNSLSAAAYIKLNDLYELKNEDFANKNDGKQCFYELRDICFETMQEKVLKHLKSVKHAAFSLDKVTVGNTPYTVLVTYYCYKGKLCVFLNSVHPMKSDEYGGEKTAEFIGKELMRTLKLSKEEVGAKYVHMVYDGVYATREERVKGGGYLDLKKHFAAWCNKDLKILTSSWDLGHIMQLVFGDSLSKNKDIKIFIDNVYRRMGKHKNYQAGLIFQETANELEHPTLTNKGAQETRWVRALLRAIQTYLRNLPTFVDINAREMIMYLKTG